MRSRLLRNFFFPKLVTAFSIKIVSLNESPCEILSLLGQEEYVGRKVSLISKGRKNLVCFVVDKRSERCYCRRYLKISLREHLKWRSVKKELHIFMIEMQNCLHSLWYGSLLSKALLLELRNSKKLDKQSYVPRGGVSIYSPQV